MIVSTFLPNNNITNLPIFHTPMQPQKQYPIPLQPLPSLPSIPHSSLTTPLPNTYIQQLKTIYAKTRDHSPLSQAHRNQIMAAYDSILSIAHRTNLYFLQEQVGKMGVEEFRSFVGELQLCQRGVDDVLIERNKKASHMYILVQGCVQYLVKNTIAPHNPLQPLPLLLQQNDNIPIGHSCPGFLIYPQQYMIPRCTNFLIKCITPCTFLSIPQQAYNRYLKKQLTKQIDKATQFIKQISIFNKLNLLNIRKYLSYFIQRSYGYNQVVYQEASQVTEVFFIVKGEVEIYGKCASYGTTVEEKEERQAREGKNRLSLGVKESKVMSIVFLGQKQCFGIDNWDSDSYGTYRKYNAKSRDSDLRVLVMNQKIFKQMCEQNPQILRTLQPHIKKSQNLHSSLSKKNTKILNSKNLTQLTQTTIKKKKANKKKKRITNNSLSWWGLAQNLKTQHKYRMPVHPSKLQNKLGEANVLESLMYHKINMLKRRFVEGEESLMEREKENYVLYGDRDREGKDGEREGSNRGNCYVPKIKARMRVLQARPFAVDMAEAVKKKLIMYAKNMGSFCDRLNLE